MKGLKNDYVMFIGVILVFGLWQFGKINFGWFCFGDFFGMDFKICGGSCWFVRYFVCWCIESCCFYFGVDVGNGIYC